MAFRRDPIDRAFRRYLAAGDPAALGDVFDRAAPELLRVALFLTGHRADAEDLVQRTFLTAIEARARFDRGRPVFPWLSGILANHARDLRRRSARERSASRPGERVADPAELAADRELAERVAALRGELGSPYREVLALHLEDGLNAKQIAARLRRPAGTVRTQLVRALDRLRERLPAGLLAGVAGVRFDASALAAIRRVVLAAARSAPPVAVPAAAVTGSVVMAKKIAHPHARPR